MRYMENEGEGQPDNLNALTFTGARLEERKVSRMEKRCVDCKYMIINEKRKPFIPLDFTTFFCRLRFDSGDDSIKVGDTKQINEMIRRPCDFTLPDGSYGFEPAGQESEQEVE